MEEQLPEKGKKRNTVAQEKEGSLLREKPRKEGVEIKGEGYLEGRES